MSKRFVQQLRTETPAVVALAWPLVLAEIGWMVQGLVDTVMVGHMRNSAEAIAGVSLGGVVFYTTAIFGGALLFSLDTKVSQSFGSGNLKDANHSLLNALYIVAVLTPPLMLLMWVSGRLMFRVHVNATVLAQAIPFLDAMNWGTLPLLLYFAFRRYLQAIDVVKPITFALISANVVNLVLDWMWIYGHWGFRAYGVVGSGWSTTVSRLYMAAVLFTTIAWNQRKRGQPVFERPFAPDFARIRELLRIGLPAAAQLLAEVSVFAVVTIWIAKLDAASVAAHQIALNCASLTYMVPLGISSAAAVRVGQGIGRNAPEQAYRAGSAAIVLGAIFMSLAAVVFATAPRVIVRIFSPDPHVMRVGVILLWLAAAFQLFDGLQTVATGALRGTGETRIPMLSTFLAYWVIGLPLGWYLGFKVRLGAAGFWIGVAFSLMLIGAALVFTWRHKMRMLLAAPRTEKHRIMA